MMVEGAAVSGTDGHGLTIQQHKERILPFHTVVPDTTKSVFKVRECQLDWIEVRRVCRQELKLHAPKRTRDDE